MQGSVLKIVNVGNTRIFQGREQLSLTLEKFICCSTKSFSLDQRNRAAILTSVQLLYNQIRTCFFNCEMIMNY